ncbi:hypothetical protein BX600DRAFT_470614 [Xylariales sp. PMI_506]|nr:hypothetical protein BX600DRAFT_470614 [Xylariales sp. PMI_506]
MVQTRKDRRSAAKFELAQPDRSGPTEKTLLQLAEERQLFQQADLRQRKLRSGTSGYNEDDSDNEEDDEVNIRETMADRVLDTILWTISLTMLHFTLDFLVQHQYGVDVSWTMALKRTAGAFVGKETVMLLLFRKIAFVFADPVN